MDAYNISENSDMFLRYACLNGYLGIVKKLIENGAVDIHADDGWALTLACVNGHLEIVKYLVEQGVIQYDISLTMSCNNGHLEVVKYLIGQGADIYARDDLVATKEIVKYLDVVIFLKKYIKLWRERQKFSSLKE